MTEKGISERDDGELYYLLVNFTDGITKEFVHLRNGQTGAEVWRQLMGDNDPKTGVSGVQAMGELIQPDRSKTNEELKKNLARWDALLKAESECRGPAADLPATVKAAAILAMVPVTMKLEILKKGKEFSENY